MLTRLDALIRDVPDYPKKNILFKDITPLLANGAAYAEAIAHMRVRYSTYDFDCIVGVEARGFFFGAPLAVQLKKGFIPVRKAGKLPREVTTQRYDLEYGTSCLEMHKEDMPAGSRVLIVDDLLATGGTTRAVTQLVEHQQCEVVEVACLIELLALNGRDKLEGFPVYSMLQY